MSKMRALVLSFIASFIITMIVGYILSCIHIWEWAIGLLDLVLFAILWNILYEKLRTSRNI